VFVSIENEPLKSKAAERAEARRLRRHQGMPMKQIATRLNVSPGSVHLWTRDIELTSTQAQRNSKRAREVSTHKWVEKNRARRLRHQEEGRAAARQGNPLHMAGCMLFWAEGSKCRNCIKLANSDVNMVAFFKKFLSDCFGIPDERFTIRLNVYLDNGKSLAEVESHWLQAIRLPPSCLRKHAINHFPTSSSGQKRNRLPYGVATVGTCDTRITQHIYGAIQEYAGFDEPRWVD
jgi:hypothetical protein